MGCNAITYTELMTSPRRVTDIDVRLTHPGPDRLNAVSGLMRDTAYRSPLGAQRMRHPLLRAAPPRRQFTGPLRSYGTTPPLFPRSAVLRNHGRFTAPEVTSNLRPAPITGLRQESDQKLCRNPDLAGGLPYHLLALQGLSTRRPGET